MDLVDWNEQMEYSDDLGRVQRALVREKAIRSAMARTGEGRKVVAEMIDAMASMDEEAVQELAEGAPTTLRDAITRYVRIAQGQKYGKDYFGDETGEAWDQVASDLSAILEYPWAAEEEFLASHAFNRSLKLDVRRVRGAVLVPDRVEIRIGDNRWLVLAASQEHHTEAGLEAIASTAGHVHRAVISRVIGDRDHHVQLNATQVAELRGFLASPSRGSFTTNTRLSVDAVAGGGILIRTRPYTYERYLAAEVREDARPITDSDVIRALHEA